MGYARKVLKSPILFTKSQSVKTKRGMDFNEHNLYNLLIQLKQKIRKDKTRRTALDDILNKDRI